MIAGIPLILLWGDMKLRLMILFMLPMTADGFLQLFTSYESKNGRRFATGVLFGLAFGQPAHSFPQSLCDGSRVDRKAFYRGQWGCRESHGTVFVIRIPEG